MKQLLITIAAVVLVGCGESLKDIWEAAEAGNIEAVKKHLAAGTDVNAKHEWGVTTLYFATVNGHKEIAELLLANGADVNAKNGRGETPLDWAILGGRTKTADLLRKHGGKTGADFDIHLAVKSGNAEAVKQHLADGTDANAKNKEGHTILQIAAMLGHKEIAELLISEGADVNVKGQDGDTPLDWAVDPDNLLSESAKIADLLRELGGKTGEELKAEGK